MPDRLTFSDRDHLAWQLLKRAIRSGETRLGARAADEAFACVDRFLEKVRESDQADRSVGLAGPKSDSG